MNRGGGWSGGRGGSGGNGGQGGGSRGRGNNNNRGSVVRFPSDHANRRDHKATGQPPRFPSDSTRPSEQQAPSGVRGRDDRRPGREGQGGQPRDNSSRDPFARERAQARENRNNGRDTRGARREHRPRDTQARLTPRLPDLTLPPELEGPVEAGATARIDPFELFCAYHLGITPQDGYKAATLTEVARRFGVPPNVVKQALYDFNLDPTSVLNSSFDLALAQMDIQVSPPGVSKTELARGLYEEFMAAPQLERDWPEPLDQELEVESAVASAGE